jgi:PAS domain S-box-containing protein
MTTLESTTLESGGTPAAACPSAPASVGGALISNVEPGFGPARADLKVGATFKFGHYPRVLVVDDEETICGTLGALLKADGFDAVTALSGEDGVELLRARRFDVAVADLVMPGLNGIQTMTALKQVDPNLEVIILSGHASVESTIAALRQGACDFLLKPLGMAQLRPALMMALEKRRGNLARAEARARAVIETAQEAIILFDKEGVVQDFNPMAEQIFGWSREQAVGRNLADFAVPPSEIEGFRAHREAAYREGKDPLKGCLEVHGLRQNGEEFPFEISTTVIDTPQGKLLSTFGRDITAHKRADEALRESEDRYRDLVENNLVLIGTHDAKGGFLSLNPAAARLLEATHAEEVVGRSLLDYVPPDLLSQFDEYLQTILQQGHAEGQMVIATPSGKVKIVEYRNTLRRQGAEEPIVRWTAQDMTERVQAEKARGFLASLVESSQDAIIGESLEGIIVSWNRGAEELYGFDAGEMMGKCISVTFPPELHDELTQHLEKIRRGETDIGHESVRVRKDGKRVDVALTISPVFDAAGEITGAVSIAHDISQHIRAEQQTRLLSAAVESAHNGIVITDRKGLIIWANPAFTRLTGYSISEVRGQNPRALKSGKHDASFYKKLWETILAGEVWEGEIVNRRKDGTLYTEEMTVTPVRDRSRVITHFIAIKQDITVRKRAEEMRQAKEAAEAASRMKSQFLASMSHEIRTPINGVIGMTRMLLDTELSAQQRRYAQVACTCGETLLTLINDILDFSKIEARKLCLEVTDYELGAMLEQTVEMLATPAGKKGLELTCLLAPGTPSLVRGDPTRLRQILLNLAGNAVKFTPRGKVRIRAGLVHEDENTVTLRFAVEDTGIGIPKDRIDAIFSPFVQADGSTTRNYGGTGLGLAISKQLVELMGGQIGLESEEGRGSTFWFTVVQQKQKRSTPNEALGRMEVRKEPARQGPKQLAHLPERAGARILVVEDIESNREVALAILTKFGYRTELVTNGVEALAALQSAPYDLVLMDCAMPEMDGYEATRRIREQEALAGSGRIPILALTAHAFSGDQAKCMEAGMDDYLSKPIDPLRLAQALETWLLKSPAQGGPKVEVPPPGALVDAVFNRGELLGRLMGDRVLAQKIVAGFLQDAPVQLRHLRKQIEAGDAAESRRWAHGLKGAAATVSAPALRDIAMKVEDAAQAGDLGRGGELLPSLEEKFEQFRMAVQEAGWA